MDQSRLNALAGLLAEQPQPNHLQNYFNQAAQQHFNDAKVTGAASGALGAASLTALDDAPWMVPFMLGGAGIGLADAALTHDQGVYDQHAGNMWGRAPFVNAPPQNQQQQAAALQQVMPRRYVNGGY